MEREYDKLVRDDIPAIIESNDESPVTHVADDAEYERRLLENLDEEVEEYREDETLLFDDADQTIGERFAESDLLGIPWKVILGNHFRETGEVELEARDGETRYAAIEEVAEIVT